MNKLSEELLWRGFVEQTTFKDLSILDNASFNFYFGVDPSAESMTIGNLAAVMLVKHFINHGHKATLLVGGATGIIGDPDGKKEERKLQTLEQINLSKNNISSQYKKLLGSDSFELVDNYSWFKNINYLEFLRNIGKHVPMRHMVNRDFVKNRLSEHGSGISYAEFSYVLIQAYDFYYLNKNNSINLQLCGSDQWGNSIAGVDLIRRLESKEAHVLSMPLIINKTTGRKFGKSEEGAVWLDESLTSVYRFYQFWLNVDDDSVEYYLRIYTFLNKSEIDEIMALFNKDRSKRSAQKKLAYEVTSFVHGKNRAKRVGVITETLFNNSSFSNLSRDDFTELEKEIGFINFSHQDIYSLLIESKLASSKNEARNFVDSGAVYVNGEKYISSENLTFNNGYLLLRRGKNKQILIKE